MRIVLTGAEGFLGWHLRCRLHALHEHEVVAVGRSTFDRLPEFVSGADAVIHVAGVNRASDDVLMAENIALAQAIADAIRMSDTQPRVVFANSIQADKGTPYGNGKQSAASPLLRSRASVGSTSWTMYRPNLFGEHGRTGYNSFVATFCHELQQGESRTQSTTWLSCSMCRALHRQ